MNLPLRAFPNWILRITCERCLKDRMLSEASAPARQRDMLLGVLIARASSRWLRRPAREGRRIVLRSG
jgi:hypothetical protein